MSVQLRLLDKADKEILKLPRAVKGAIYDFQRKFREDPNSHGLQFKQLGGDSRLYSARVTDAYRALLLRVTGTEYLLVAVKPQRAEVWQLVEQFTKRLTEANLWTFRQVAAHAARIEQERTSWRPVPPR